MHEIHLGILRVERSAVDASAARSANHDGDAGPPAVPALRCEIRNLVESAGDEIRELHLRNGPHSHERRANSGSHNSRFRNWSVDHAPLAEAFKHAGCDFKGPTINANVLTEYEDTFIFFHFFQNTLANCFDVRGEAHFSKAESCAS